MRTKEEIKEKYQKELTVLEEKHKRELEELMAEADLAANGIQTTFISHHVVFADYSVTVATMTPARAFEYMEQFETEPISLVKGLFTTFCPEWGLAEYLQKNPNATATPVGNCIYDVGRHEKKLNFYTQVGRYKLKVAVPLDDPATRISYNKRGNHSGDVWVENVQLHHNGTFQKNIRWSSGGREYPNSFTLYNKGEDEQERKRGERNGEKCPGI